MTKINFEFEVAHRSINLEQSELLFLPEETSSISLQN